ncbi:MAG: transcription elongation factor GreA [Oscillospiraceae bacterium]|nr:transcription elongation factor GreA [Oscillospiraceae bacterium]
MANPVKLTPKRLKELQDEMVWMKTVREKEVAEQIKEARSFGDLSENSEYDEAKNEQGKLYSREAEVQAILDNYILIEEDAFDDTVINLGCTVTVLDLELDEEEEYRIVGSQEADPMEGRISEESPFGKALMGKEVGDEIVVEAPVGELKYRVVNIAVNR